MKGLRISAVQNGYIVTEDMELSYGRRGGDAMFCAAPYVFETFAAMTAWIDANLEKPAQAKKEGES